MPIPPSPTATSLIEHMGFVRSVARATLRGDDAVDDIVQDTMVAALDSPKPPRGSLRTWLGGVARNNANNYIRRRMATRKHEQHALKKGSTEPADDVLSRAEEGRRLVAAVLRLDDIYRTPVLLRFYDGLPPREIASRLGKPVETVRTRIKRGLSKLRDDLEQTHRGRKGGWQAALLPLANRGSAPVLSSAAAVAGGALMGKKAIALGALAALILGGTLWLKPWANDSTANEINAVQPVLVGDLDQTAPELRTSPFKPQASESTTTDFANIDRDRDLHGTVVDTEGNPVGGAKVTALRYPWRVVGGVREFQKFFENEVAASTSTTSDGRFVLQIRPGNNVHLRVEAKGLASTELSTYQAGERTRVTIGKSVRLLLNVIAPDQTPLANVPLRLFVVSRSAGPALNLTAETDAHGQAKFDRLPGGLKAWLELHPQKEGVGVPGTIRIELPQEGEYLKKVIMPTGRTIRGSVLNASTKGPIPGACISGSASFTNPVKTDEQGQFVMHGWTKAPGEPLYARAPGFTSTVSVDKDNAEHAIALRPSIAVRGRVVDEKGTPIEGARVSAMEAHRRHEGPPSIGTTSTNPEGEFVLTELRCKTHLLFVHREGFARVARMIAVLPTMDAIDITLNPPCQILGTVADVDGLPLKRVSVSLFRNNVRNASRHARLVCATDDLGRFRFSDLDREEYEIYVGELSDPIIRKTVLLTEREPIARLDLAPASKRRVTIRIVDTDGKPVPNFSVGVVSKSPNDRKSSMSNDLGIVTFDLGLHTYEVHAYPRYNSPYAHNGPIQLDRSQKTATLALRPLIPIRGTVVKPDRAPIPFAMIKVIRDDEPTRIALANKRGEFSTHVDSGVHVSLVFDGQVKVDRRETFIPFRASQNNVEAGSTGLVLRAQPIDTNQELTVELLDPSGKPLSGVQLVVRIPPNRSVGAVTDSRGRATLKDIPALELRLTLSGWAPSTERPWILPTLTKCVPNGQTIQAQCRLGRPVRGQIVNEDGSEITRMMFVSVLQGGTAIGFVPSDQQGRFTAVFDPRNSDSGSFKIEAHHPIDNIWYRGEIQLKPDQRSATLVVKQSKK